MANVNFVYFSTPLLESKRVYHHELKSTSSADILSSL